MNNSRKITLEIDRRQTGAVLPLIAICLVVLIFFVALAVDLGRLYVSRNELQNAADAAALGATRQLGMIYKDNDFEALSSSEQLNYDVTQRQIWDGETDDDQVIIQNAQEVALQNRAANEAITIGNADVQIGVWEPTDPDGNGDKFRLENIRPTAVRVTVHRDESNVSGNISMFFAGIFGLESSPVSTRATAALTGAAEASEGELEMPVGLSRSWFLNHSNESGYCGSVIRFSATTNLDACAGWTSFDYIPSSASALKDQLIPGIIAGTYQSPAIGSGDELEFVNGNLTSVFEPFMSLYQTKGQPVDRFYDPSQPLPQPVAIPTVPLCSSTLGGVRECPKYPNGTYDTTSQLRYPPCPGNSGNCNGPLRFAQEWTTSVPIYDSDECTPNNGIPILGFARVTVYDVGHPAYQQIGARIDCDFEEFRGGGPSFGLIGTIPGLVE